MARTTVTAIDPAPVTATNLTYSAADQANGNDCLFNGDVMLNVLNSNAATRTITITANGAKEKGVAIPNLTATVPANTGNILLDHIPRDYYVQSDGKLWIDWSADAGVTFAVIKK